MRRAGVPLAAVLAASLQLACAAHSPIPGMVPEHVESTEHPQSYRVRIESAGLRDREITNADFRAALATTLVRSQIFREVIDEGDSDYLLDVFIHLEEPEPRSEREPRYTAVARWTLTELDSRRTVFQEIVHSSHKARRENSSWNQNPIHLASEGAVKANIAEGIRRLSALQLGPSLP